ncbi:MAG: hypothetical protein ACKVZ0_16175 [Gemmatimonadales bacterium]
MAQYSEVNAVRAASSSGNAAPPLVFGGLQDFLIQGLNAVNAVNAVSAEEGKPVAIAALERLARSYDEPDVNEFVALSRTAVNKEAIALLIHQKIDHLRTFTRVAEFARSTLKEVTPRRPEPADQAWASLREAIRRPDGTWCSLIYCYWLEEGGLPWTLERLADRVENGLARHTQPLTSVRVREDSGVKDILSNFIALWQQGQLSAIDERRRQYQALYGFPVHAAARWGRLDAVDPRAGFPAAFHRFLHEAMRFYRERRDLQVEPDPSAAKEAFGSLAEILFEGNENLRIRVPPEIRAQFEYTKQAIGGFDPGAVLAKEWREFLPGRPGVRDSVEPWQHAADTVASLYGWKRPGIREYTSLAEDGELILVMSRQLARLRPISDDIWFAFLVLMQEPIGRYVNTFKTVSGIDLEARLVTVPPAELLSRRYQAPELPPLRRNWAAELPVGT